MVNIYLPTDRGQVLALTIPFSDIERLSVRPVKWLRFVTFAICGVRGHLSESPMPDGTLSTMTITLIIFPKITIIFLKVISVAYH